MSRVFFAPRLVNGPGGDPALFVDLIGLGRALLFDLGRIDRLRPSEILRITDVFVSHTHIDHFIGFDHFLRIHVGQARRVRLYGPKGFLKNVEGKLAAYTWNLVENAAFSIDVFELDGAWAFHRAYRCANRFEAEGEVEAAPVSAGTILEEPGLEVRFVPLDHGIPSLAFAAIEAPRINIDRDALEAFGGKPGAWVAKLKDRVARGETGGPPLRVGGTDHPLETLKERLVRVTPGEHLAYVADAGASEENERRIVGLARGADRFFCEGGFLREDARHAEDMRHLTAWDAGRLASKAGAKHLTVFHFSPKYVGRFEALKEEADQAFKEGGVE